MTKTSNKNSLLQIIRNLISPTRKMKSLQIDPTNALKLYPGADPAFKQMLEDTFGKEFFNQKITDRATSYEACCEIKGCRALQLSDFQCMKGMGLSDKEIEAHYGLHVLTVVSEVLNEGWIPDWNDSNQKKHFPWFKWNGSGFGFSYAGYDFTHSDAHVGSRLSLKNSALAEFMGKNYVLYYNMILTK